MKITFEDVAQRFEAVIAKRLSFDAADRWAWSVMLAEDAGTLEFEPESDEERIWRGVSYLHGIDMETAPGSYLYSVEDVREAFLRIRDGQAP